MDESQKHHRKSPRLPDYDYSQSGAYFVTLCAHHRQPLFGLVDGDEMNLNACGEIAFNCWTVIPEHFQQVELDMFVVMPNHIHGILVIHNKELDNTEESSNPLPSVGLRHASTLQKPPLNQRRGAKSGSLGAIIGSYKSAVTHAIREYENSPKLPIWQRSFHDHIIRNETSLNKLREYIQTNPARWTEDRYYSD